MAGTAALPALSTSAPAVDDPVLSAIARHREAYAAHAELFKEWNCRNQDPPAELATAAGDAEAEALNTLLGTTPTTLAGAIAVCRYIAECQPPNLRTPGAIFWDGDEQKAIGIMQRLADCMAKHALTTERNRTPPESL
jgi:hypothetical protein